MGNFNDFDLDIKKVQAGNEPTAWTSTPCWIVEQSLAHCTVIITYYSCNDTCTCDGVATCEATCFNSCGVTCGGGCKR